MSFHESQGWGLGAGLPTGDPTLAGTYASPAGSVGQQWLVGVHQDLVHDQAP